MCADPKSVKISQVFDLFLGSTSVKAGRKTLVKSIPCKVMVSTRNKQRHLEMIKVYLVFKISIVPKLISFNLKLFKKALN